MNTAVFCLLLEVNASALLDLFVCNVCDEQKGARKEN